MSEYPLHSSAGRFSDTGFYDPEIGFIARMLALCCLPRTNPGDKQQYIRQNGPFHLILTAGGTAGLPYGSLPRLLLAWMSTEAVRTQSPTLVLGSSLAEFIRDLGFSLKGGGHSGPRGIRVRLKNQIDRLFHASLSLHYRDDRNRIASANAVVAKKVDLWWSHEDRPRGWQSTIRLGEDLFYEMTRHAVPLDRTILRHMKRSSLGLDLYLWLTYRLFTLRQPLSLSWPTLYQQLGARPEKSHDHVTVQNFRKSCVRELNKLQGVWPQLKLGYPTGVLRLYPTPPRIAPRSSASRRFVPARDLPPPPFSLEPPKVL